MTTRFRVRFVVRDFWTTIATEDPSKTSVSILLSRAMETCFGGREAPLESDQQLTPDTVLFTSSTSPEVSQANLNSLSGDEKDYGLYLPSRGHWLEPGSRCISEFGISDGEVIELQQRNNLITTTAKLSHYAEGWLMKKGTHSVLWKKRFFVVKDEMFSWFRSKTDSQPLGFVNLAEGGTCIESDEQQEYFQIVTRKKTYRMKASGPSDRSSWIRILTNVIENYRGKLMERTESFSVFSSSSSITSYHDDEDSEFGDEEGRLAPIYIAKENNDSMNGFDNAFSHLNLSNAISKTRTSCSMGLEKSNHTDIEGDKVGFLYKKGHVNTAMKYRLFVLKDKLLFYYKFVNCSESPTNVLEANSSYRFAGMINLEGARIYSDRKNGKKSFIFRIVAPGRVYVLSTTRFDEWRDWRDAFECVSGVTVEDVGCSFSLLSDCVLARPSVDISETSSMTASSEIYDISMDSIPKSHVMKPHRQPLVLELSTLNPPDHEGMMWKQGNDRLKKFRQRWFTLIGRTLFYAKCDSRLTPIGSIPLSLCQMRQEEQNSNKFEFSLVLRNESLAKPVLREYVFRAPDQASFHSWLRVISMRANASK